MLNSRMKRPVSIDHAMAQLEIEEASLARPHRKSSPKQRCHSSGAMLCGSTTQEQQHTHIGKSHSHGAKGLAVRRPSGQAKHVEQTWYLASCI
jgi:hypothetical protein